MNRLRKTPRLRQLRGLLSLVSDLFPWTPLGLLLTAFAAYGLWHFAYAELDLVWLVLGYAMLCLLVLAPLVVVPAAVWMRFVGANPRRRAALLAESRERLVLETGQQRTTGFVLPKLSLVPLLQIDWRWQHPKRVLVSITRSAAGRTEHVTPQDRGLYSDIVRRIAVSDAFGLCRIWVRRDSERSVMVMPALRGLARMASFSSFAAGDELPHPHGLSEGDRLELRGYQPGDPVRFMHWKILARSGQLVVRTPERALSVAHRVAAFLIAGPEDDATAAVARLALVRGFLGEDFLFATAEQPDGVSKAAAGLELVVRSIEHRASGAEGLSRFFAVAGRAGPTSFVLFAPPVPGPWLTTTVAACRGQRVHVIIGVDGLRPSHVSGTLRRLVFADGAGAGHSAAALALVVQRFRAAGCTVAVYDRPAGRRLNSAQAMAGEREDAA